MVGCPSVSGLTAAVGFHLFLMRADDRFLSAATGHFEVHTGADVISGVIWVDRSG